MPSSQLTIEPRTQPYVFYLGPFRFESEIDIPELRTSRGSGETQVTIRRGGVPALIDGAIQAGSDCQLSATEYLLDIPGTARYYVRNGNEVRVDIVHEAPIANVSLYLLGSVFGVLCHQNGLLPLHASAVESAGVVTAFLGDSGAGKSTLAACLRRRGHRVISDDICLLRPIPQPELPAGPDSQPLQVVPVAGWLKLWNQSLQHLGETPIEQNRVFSTDDKFRLFLSDPGSQPFHLACVVFLARASDPDATPVLDRVPLLDAIAGLMQMTYAGYVPALSGQNSRVFQQCARVIQHAQAWRLTMPWGLDRIDSALDLLERDILAATTTDPIERPSPN